MNGFENACNACASGVIVSRGRALELSGCVAKRKSGVLKRDWPALILLETYVPVNANSVPTARSQESCCMLAGVAVGSGVKREGKAAARAEPSVDRNGPPSLSLDGSPGFSP